MPLNNVRPGPNWTDEFQASPVPFVSSSTATGIVRVDFRDHTLSGSWAEQVYVSKWVAIHNSDDANELGVAFTRRGFDTTNNFSLAAGQSFAADLRLTSVFLSGSGTDYQVIAGLTGIPGRAVLVITGSNGFPGVG